MSMRYDHYKIGKMGEDAAAAYIDGRGYTIVARNYHSRFGEVDIIAVNDKFIAFIEVKTRKNGAMVTAFESVDRFKQKKIIKTAMIYLQKGKINLQPRFDAIEVLVDKKSGCVKAVNHLENAFFEEDFCGEDF